MNNTGNIAAISLRATFFIVLLGLAYLHIGPLFRGLNSAHGMEQATIAREVARGNGLKTKVIRPIAVRLNQEVTDETGTLIDATQNTYHAPLYPLLMGAIFKMQGADNFEAYRPTEGEYVYALDRVVAAFSIVCFMLAIGVTYILVCRIFDSKIAATTSILMLFCGLFWEVSMSGLPQMLMLLLFTSGSYFAYRSIEASEEGGLAFIHALLAAVFFALLCLAHWLAVWIVIGYSVAAALFIKPRGVAGIIALVAVILVAIMPIIHNVEVTGNPGGTGIFVLFEGLAGSEEVAMRSLETVPYSLRQFTLTVLRLTVDQLKDLYLYFGSILAAPIFFMALFHPFKRRPISDFRWALLIMWIVASIGMALFGLTDGRASANQLHLLFAPIFAAYGLAMLSVLWTRLDFTRTVPLMGNAHLVLVVLISSSSFLLTTPFAAVRAFQAGSNGLPPNYPPYAPSVLDATLVEFTEENEIIASDQPWAVSWYTDRYSLWLPMKLSQLEEIDGLAEAQDTPVVGVLTTPISNGTRPLNETAAYYSDYLSLMLDGWAAAATNSPERGIVSSRDKDLGSFYNRYPHHRILFFRAAPMVFHSARNIDL